MQNDDSMRRMMEAISKDDKEAEDRLFEECFSGLARYADAHLRRSGPGLKDASGRDFAQSVLALFVGRLKAGKFRTVANKSELWKLLQTITKRRVIKRLKKKRLRGGSAVERADGESGPGFGQFSHDAHGHGELPAAVAAEAEDTCNHLMGLLADDTSRRIVELRLEGCTVKEIADQLGYGKSAIETRIAFIKNKWSRYYDSLE